MPPAHPRFDAPQTSALLVCVNAQRCAHTLLPHVHRVACSLGPVLCSQLCLPPTASKSRHMVELAAETMSASLACMGRCIIITGLRSGTRQPLLRPHVSTESCKIVAPFVVCLAK